MFETCSLGSFKIILLLYWVWLGFAYTFFSIIDNLQDQGQGGGNYGEPILANKSKVKAKVNFWDLNLAR